MDIPPQGVITRDNVTITIDTVVFYQITDPAKAVYEIQSLKKGIEYLAITTIRDIIGKMNLDETFSSRDGINNRMNLARLLLEKTDILLLDEPTNHLDLNSVEWLEGYINAFTQGSQAS